MSAGSIGWVAGNFIPFWLLLKWVGHLRVPVEEELAGIDHSYHGGTAYPAEDLQLTDLSVSKGIKQRDSPSACSEDLQVVYFPANFIKIKLPEQPSCLISDNW